MEAEVYRLCDSAQTPVALIKGRSARRGTQVSTQEVEQAIETLCRAKVLLSLNGKLLTIGVNVTGLAYQ